MKTKSAALLIQSEQLFLSRAVVLTRYAERQRFFGADSIREQLARQMNFENCESLCVLCVSAVRMGRANSNRRDAENAGTRREF